MGPVLSAMVQHALESPLTSRRTDSPAAPDEAQFQQSDTNTTEPDSDVMELGMTVAHIIGSALHESYSAVRDTTTGMTTADFMRLHLARLMQSTADEILCAAVLVDRIFVSSSSSSASTSASLLSSIVRASRGKQIELLWNQPIHIVFAVAVVLAHKWLRDLPHKNAFYARMIGKPVALINKLERLFVLQLNFGIAVSSEQLEPYLGVIRELLSAHRDADSAKRASTPSSPVDTLSAVLLAPDSSPPPLQLPLELVVVADDGRAMPGLRRASPDSDMPMQPGPLPRKRMRV